MERENDAGLRQRSGARSAAVQPAAVQLGEKEQQALALKLLSKARAKQIDVEHVEARMDEIAELVDSGLNRDTERDLLQEMSQLRHRKQALQKEAMAALDEAAELRPALSGAEVKQRSTPRRGTLAASSTQPETTAATTLSRAQRVATESTPGALLKPGSGGATSKIDWCALAMVYVKAAAMFAFVFWLVRSELKLLAPCCSMARGRSRQEHFCHDKLLQTTASFATSQLGLLSLPRCVVLVSNELRCVMAGELAARHRRAAQGECASGGAP